MHSFFRTLRFRLVLLSLSVFGAIHVGRSVWIYLAADRFLHERFDSRIAAEAGTIVDAMRIFEEHGLTWASYAGSLLRALQPVDGGIVVRDADGRVIGQTDNLVGTTIPWTTADAEARLTGNPVLETLEADDTRRFESGRAARIVTIFRDLPGNDHDGYVQVVVSLQRTESAIESVGYELTIVTIGAVVVIAIASFVVVRRALAPIGQIAREARDMTADHLDRRLPLPPGRDEVAEMVDTLNALLGRIEAAFRSQERFIANAAHELRTPVTHMLGQAQVLLLQDRPLQEYRLFVAGVQDEMRALKQVIEALLVLARADAGLPATSRTPQSPNEIAMEAVQRCQLSAQQRGVRLVPQLLTLDGDDAEPTILGDAELLVTMISNLLRNAVRFSPPSRWVELEVIASTSTVEFAVRDSGPGIPAALLPRLFERFVQLDGAPPEQKGTGLGLAIARSVATAHGGSIRVQNRPEGGCEFRVTLPATRFDADPATMLTNRGSVGLG